MTDNKVKPKSSTENSEAQNIDDIVNLEKRERATLSISEKLADSVTAFTGSMIYVGLHAIWFGTWMILNLGALPSLKPFDPSPFSLLSMIVSLEAIFLTAFVLISQNKQALQAEKRAKVDLQINLLAERENTKLIKMVDEIHQHLGIRRKEDREQKELKKTTNVDKMVDKVEKKESE